MALARLVKKATKKVVLEYHSDCAKDVYVAGSFNDWDPARDRLSGVGENGTFRATLKLPKGRHEYRLVVDGVWCSDPANPDWVPNDQGSTNSVLTVS